MVNGMGRDRGAALVVEQSVLPATVADSQRTMAFAQYNVLQDIGHAAGSLLAAAPALLQRFTALDATRLHCRCRSSSTRPCHCCLSWPICALSDRVEVPRSATRADHSGHAQAS